MSSQLTTEQARAIQPDSHVWVSASAGSGKTQVLTERVVRLLIEGAPPESLLCITFTRAAAAEMAGRLFHTLATLATADDTQLARELARLGAEARCDPRTLLARTLEARGGIKIMTIHAFCQSLLARFPMEAGLAPGFRTLDDSAQRQLERESFEALLAQATQDASLDADLARLAGLQSDSQLSAIITGMARQLDKCSAADLSLIDGLTPLYRQALGLPEMLDARSWFSAAMDQGGIDRDLLADIERVWQAHGGKRIHAYLDKIRAWRAGDPFEHFDSLYFAFSTQKHQVIQEKDYAVNKAIAATEPDFYSKVLRLHAQLTAMYEMLVRFRLLDVTLAAARCGWRLLQGIRAAKIASGRIGFGDLVQQASLLMQAPTADWVRYKLDDRIQTILVDEAQDTNHAQWAIVDALSEDYFAGESAARSVRRVFAVGDDKQSIYGFQGTEPRIFADKRGDYETKAARAEQPFDPVTLATSFRSGPAVIDFVNTSLAQLGAASLGLAAEPEPHRAFHHQRLGSVTLWQAIEQEKVDALEPDVVGDLNAPWRPDAEQLLAQRIAEQVADWIASGHAQPGDIMILLRRRSELMAAIVSHLKARGVPVGGIDRIRLLDELAVKDVLAALRFVLQPRDDLNLACLLKSPLLGLSEDELFALCHGRGNQSLWQRLRASGHQQATDMLERLLARADFTPPFEFLGLLLHELRGRERMIARLGVEADDPLTMLMDMALGFESDHAPSLHGFIAWLETSVDESKREQESARGMVRLMTVHGAKGLQAPIVILADARSRSGKTDPIVAVDGLPVFYGSRDNAPQKVLEAIAGRDQRSSEEYWRTYYVAITRAADQLYVTGWVPERSDPDRPGRQLAERSWYGAAQQALDAMPGVEVRDDERWGRVVHLVRGSEPPVRVTEPQEPTDHAAEPAPVAGEHDPLDVLSPSALMPTETRSAASVRLRGDAVHLLLEHLPGLADAEREVAGTNLLRRTGLDPAAHKPLLASVLALLRQPELAPLFAPTALVEAPVSALLPDGRRLSGRIDRLVIGSELVLLDYKSSALVPDSADQVPQSVVAQMAAYRWALRRSWDRPVRVGLLYAAGPRLIWLPEVLLDVAETALLRSQSTP